MRFYKVILIVSAAVSAFACNTSEQRPLTPLDTLKSYTTAIKRKDTTSMKLLLSDASLKMDEQQARAQNTTVDEVVKRETLFNESQNRLEYRNEKTEGDRATIEVKNSSDSWDTVPFILEQGVWKIDKQAMVNQRLQQETLDNEELDKRINESRIP
jgi:hypothetical protein